MNSLQECIEISLAESRFRTYLINEGLWDFINYGVTERAVDKFFGGSEKLKLQVQNELKKQSTGKVDPDLLKNEIIEKSNSAANKLMSQEFLLGLKNMLAEGLLNGIINAFVNSVTTLVLTLNPKSAIESLLKGFVTGILIKFLLRAIELVYNEFKKRILKDPYAEPSIGEMIVITLLTIATFTAGYGAYLGYGAPAIVITIVINVCLSAIATVVFNFSKFKNR